MLHRLSLSRQSDQVAALAQMRALPHVRDIMPYVRDIISASPRNGPAGPAKPGGPGGPGGNSDQDSNTGPNTGVVVKARPKTRKPAMYKVLMLNDDYTPMEFVVHVLERFFQKNRDEATRIMLHVHKRGVGVCGVFTYEVAETKVTQVMDLARQNQHPLQCTIEKD
jgi:ATP-dependent Clp protease adaptor protein ClpS